MTTDYSSKPPLIPQSVVFSSIESTTIIKGYDCTFDYVDMRLGPIINLREPEFDSDAATKYYVDLGYQQLSEKNSVVAATTITGTLASSFANNSIIDGITLTTGNRILIKNQSNLTENGIYTVNASGSPTRVSDLNTGATAAGIFVFVEQGTINVSSGWICNSTIGNDVIDLDDITFTTITSGTSSSQETFVGANNQTDDVTGLLFLTSAIRSFKVLMSIVVLADDNLYAQFELQGIQKDTGWYFVFNYVGDDTGVTFSITTNGQIQYTSANYAGFLSLKMDFKRESINVS